MKFCKILWPSQNIWTLAYYFHFFSERFYHVTLNFLVKYSWMPEYTRVVRQCDGKKLIYWIKLILGWSFTDLPDEGPIISGGFPRYHIGDKVEVNCTSKRSKPAAKLKWYINGEQADQNVVKNYEVRISFFWITKVENMTKIWSKIASKYVLMTRQLKFIKLKE